MHETEKRLNELLDDLDLIILKMLSSDILDSYQTI